MKVNITILKNEEVLNLMKDISFINKWNKLVSQSNKVTVQQEHPFVSTWYDIYSDNYQAILILGYDDELELIGLIPLAFSKEKKYLTHAGDWQTEYKGWLCKKDLDEFFIPEALIAIKHQFHLKKWDWGWVAPKSNMNWIFSTTLNKEKIYCKIEEENSPLLDLHDDNILDKIKKSRSIRTKMNRFKKRGLFFIERITSKEKAKNILDVLEKQCDFRQLAVNRITPFRNDLNKKTFHVEKLNFPKDNHFSVLWSNNQPVAFNYGECDSETVQLGVTSYDPLQGKNSPGIIFIIKLAELLKQEGYRFFDLTPGRNEYKQTFCNLTQKVYKITLFFNKTDKIIFSFKSSIINSLKYLMTLIRLNPKTLLEKKDKFVRLIKNTKRISKKKLISNFISLIYHKEELLLYKILTDNPLLDNLIVDKSLNINHYWDLMLFNDLNESLCKTKLISNALKRFNTEDLLYTIVINGELAQYGWLANARQSRFDLDGNIILDFPDNSVVLYDLFTDRNYRNLGLFESMVKKMIVDSKKNEVSVILIRLQKNNIFNRNIIENIGFINCHKTKKIKLLGFEFVKYSDINY